ncbi:MAG: MarC family protein [Methanobacteriota archaeon]
MVDVAFAATAMASIFAVVDPIGVTPFFSLLTEGMTADEKRRVIVRTCLVSGSTLAFFALFGQWIFVAFGFTLPAFRIAGGILLFGVAFEMLHGERSRSRLTQQEREETLEREEVGVVPLGIPLLAGPGAITTVMIYMARPVASEDRVFVVLGIALVVVATYVILHYADRMFRRIGRTGARAIGRIMGLLLAAIAVEFVIDGVLDVARANGWVA